MNISRNIVKVLGLLLVLSMVACFSVSAGNSSPTRSSRVPLSATLPRDNKVGADSVSIIDAPGTIIENTVLDGQNLTIMNSPNSIIRNVTIANISSLIDDYGIKIDSSPGTIISNVTIYNLASSTDMSAISIVNSLNVSVSDVRIDDIDAGSGNDAYGIYVDNGDEVKIFNSSISNMNLDAAKADGFGIYISNTNHGSIEDNMIDNIRGKDSGSYTFSDTYGIQLYRSDNFVVATNNITNIIGSSSYVTYIAGIALDEVTDTILSGNILSDLTTSVGSSYAFGDIHAIYMVFTTNITIAGTQINQVSTNGNAWALAAGIYAEQGSELAITNSSISNLSNTHGDGARTAGIYYLGQDRTNITNVEVSNIFSESTSYGIYVSYRHHNIKNIRVTNVESDYSTQTASYGLLANVDNSSITQVEVTNVTSNSNFYTSESTGVFLNLDYSTASNMTISNVDATHHTNGIRALGSFSDISNITAENITGMIATVLNITDISSSQIRDVLVENVRSTTLATGISMQSAIDLSLGNVNIVSNSSLSDGLSIIDSSNVIVSSYNFTGGQYFGTMTNLTEINFEGGSLNSSSVPVSRINRLPTSKVEYFTKPYELIWDIELSQTADFELRINNTLYSEGQWPSNSSIRYSSVMNSNLLNFTFALNTSQNTFLKHFIELTGRSDTVPPVFVTVPSTISFEVGETEIVTWEVSEDNPGNYSVFIEGVSFLNGTYGTDGIISIEFNVTNPPPVGTGQTLEIIIYDYFGNSVSDTVNFWVYKEYDYPEIANPQPDQTLSEDEAVIEYEVTDLFPYRYKVAVDGVDYKVGDWNDSVVKIDLRDLTAGIYSIRVEFHDRYQNVKYDYFELTVTAVPPIISSSPEDLELVVGFTPTTLSWTVEDGNPSHYNIYLNDALADDGAWSSGQEITYEISDLAIGSHTFKLEINDTKGNTVTDTVTVSVVEETSDTTSSSSDPTVSQSPTSDNPTSTSSTKTTDDSRDASSDGGFLPMNGSLINLFLFSAVYLRRRRKDNT